MINSRQKILNYIQEHQSTTVEELSKVFQVSPANIRHHLSILSQQGSVKIIGQKKDAQRGRPAQLYASSQQTDQNNLTKLADALLIALFNNRSSDERTQLMSEIALLLGMDFKYELNNPTARVYSAIRSVNRMNYHAHWEAHIESPRLILDHCPYRMIIDFHPELCQLDALLFENLMGAPVKQVEKLTMNNKGLPHCVFLIKTPTY